mgnify:CR=1 FL=1
MTKPIWRRALLSVVMIALALFIGVPLYYILVNTFKTQGQMVANPLAPPTELFLGNYKDVFSDPRIFQSFANTLYVTALSVLLQLLVGALAAYAMIIRTSRINTILASSGPATSMRFPAAPSAPARPSRLRAARSSTGWVSTSRTS